MNTLPAFVERAPEAANERVNTRAQERVAVLLLHGIGGGKSIWQHSLQALAAAGFHAAALDFPGYGESSGAPTMDAMCGAVRSLVQHLGHTRTVLVGHSMGGMVAQEVVARETEHGAGSVQGLVLACTSASFGKADGAWQAQFIQQRLAPLDAGLGMAGMAQQLVPAMLAPGASAAARDAAMAVMSKVPQATYRTALHAIAAFDRRAALATMHMPTLCLAAEHDHTAPPAVMQRLRQRVPGAEYACLADAGHIANLEQPQAFNRAVLEFLQRHFA